MSDSAAPGQRLLKLWRTLERIPGGAGVFSRVLGRTVPYTGTIGARVVELEPGRAVIALADRKKVRNHLGSVHAVALVNLGELATGLSVLTALPPGVRGIVTNLSAAYLKKARGPIIATADVRALGLGDIRVSRDLEVSADLTNVDGETVARVTARWRVGP